jgi:hypothetical protein
LDSLVTRRVGSLVISLPTALLGAMVSCRVEEVEVQQAVGSLRRRS